MFLSYLTELCILLTFFSENYKMESLRFWALLKCCMIKTYKRKLSLSDEQQARDKRLWIWVLVSATRSVVLLCVTSVLEPVSFSDGKSQCACWVIHLHPLWPNKLRVLSEIYSYFYNFIFIKPKARRWARGFVVWWLQPALHPLSSVVINHCMKRCFWPFFPMQTLSESGPVWYCFYWLCWSFSSVAWRLLSFIQNVSSVPRKNKV